MDPATITAAVAAAIKLVEMGQKIMEERRRNRELTPEEEGAWDREVASRLRAPHWQPSNVKPA
jgi:hypothetical protein